MAYRPRLVIRILVLLMAKRRSNFARLLAAAVSAQKHGHTVRARILLDLAISEIDKERVAIVVQQQEQVQPIMKNKE
jgi:hypothetical protein